MHPRSYKRVNKLPIPLVTPVMANSYITAITVATIQDAAGSLLYSNTAPVNEIKWRMLLLTPNAEVCCLTPPVLIQVLILRTLCTYSHAVSLIVKASEYTGALPVTTWLLVEI